MANHILYATDKNYCELCAVSLYSLLSNLHGEVVIHIIESSLEERKDDLIKIAKMFNKEIDFIPIEDISRRLVEADIPPYRGGYSPYARFFISDYVDDGRVLYLDCDTIIKGDVAPLINYDLNGCPLGAVIDQSSSHVNVLIGHHQHDRYYNSGILLFDVAKCRETDVPERFLEAVKTIDLSNTFLGADQEIMNVAYYHQIATLPQSANMMFTIRFFEPSQIWSVSSKGPSDYYTKEEFIASKNNPLIIHFAGGGRYQPWREEGIYYMDEDADLWFDTYEKLYPDGRYDVAKLKKIMNERKKHSFFKTAGTFPGLYCSLKGLYRGLKLLPKRIRARRAFKSGSSASSGD